MDQPTTSASPTAPSSKPKPSTRKPHPRHHRPISNNSEHKAAKKKRHRDLTRLLSRPSSLPADIRVEHERELSSLSQDLQRTKQREKDFKIARRYKMVRLIERKKAARHLKQARVAQERAQNEEDKARWEQAVRELEVDLNYTIYCPIFKPYSSLYKGEKGQEEPNRRKEMWAVVKRCTEEKSEALERLRFEGTEISQSEANNISRERKKGTKRGEKSQRFRSSSRTGEAQEGRHDEDEDDDGGGMSFFET